MQKVTHNHRTAIAGLICVAILYSCSEVRVDDVSSSSLKITEVLTEDSFNKAILLSPNDPQLYLDRARFFRKNSKLKEAFADAERALKIDSLLPEAHQEKALVYYMSARLGEAKFEFEKAVAIDPDYIPAHLQLAEIYLVLKNYDRSMEEINIALRIDPQDDQGYFLKGLIYKEQGNMDLAKSSFQTASELNADNVEAFNFLGMIYAKEDDAVAMDYYNTALAIDSSHKEALYNRAFFIQDQGYPQDALEAYDLLLKFYPGTAVAYYNKGYIYYNYLADLEQASSAFSEAIRCNPSYYQAFYNRAVALEDIGRTTDAIKDYKAVIHLKSDHPQALAALNRLGAK